MARYIDLSPILAVEVPMALSSITRIYSLTHFLGAKVTIEIYSPECFLTAARKIFSLICVLHCNHDFTYYTLF